jgi:hypothetical protein
MKIKHLVAVAGLVAAGTALAHGDGFDNVLFRFDGAIGVQPFRSGQGGVPAANIVAGVNPGGAPWGMTSFRAMIKTTGEIRARGTGVLLWGADGIGTRAGPRQVILSLFCRSVPVPPAVAGTVVQNAFNSAPVDLNEDGDFFVRGALADSTGAAPPLTCGDDMDNRPVLLVRAVTAATATTPAAPSVWFAAGIIAPKHGHD